MADEFKRSVGSKPVRLSPCQEAINKRLELDNKALLHTMADMRADHLEQIARFDKVQQQFIDMASHTSAIALGMQEANKTNRDLVGIIAGKKQVPLSVFLMVVTALCTILILVVAQDKWAKVGLGNWLTLEGQHDDSNTPQK